jgi:hypothetical protein
MGARMVLELARQGVGRHVVALDPGGFWSAAEKAVFATSVKASFALVKALRPALPALAGKPGRADGAAAAVHAAPVGGARARRACRPAQHRRDARRSTRPCERSWTADRSWAVRPRDASCSAGAAATG